eukprot:1159545-Pelagomonas_calceolata.AAC.8
MAPPTPPPSFSFSRLEGDRCFLGERAATPSGLVSTRRSPGRAAACPNVPTPGPASPTTL